MGQQCENCFEKLPYRGWRFCSRQCREISEIKSANEKWIKNTFDPSKKVSKNKENFQKNRIPTFI